MLNKTPSNSWLIFLSIATLVGGYRPIRAESSETKPQIIDVFVGEQNGYPVYRIPALVLTERGTLLAFAEARKSLRDHAENKIVMKRSTDTGSTWGALKVIHD